MAQALYRKWRPRTFDDLVGQEHIVRTLRHALRTGHIHHAYLLAGPRGTGKTSTARLIAKAVNCLAPDEERPCDRCEICRAITDGRLMDLVEIDAASNTGVDNIRELLEKVGFRPTQARYKVYVVDEVHMLSTAAFNALLKTLEEPPAHVIFVLATTEVHKIPETILSRCQRFEFRRIPLAALVGQLRLIAEAESLTAEPEALELIARAATGSMRDAISLFDQMASTGNIAADQVRLVLGAERREVVQALLQAWVDHEQTEGIRLINDAVDSGADPRQLARQVADFLRGLLLMRLGAGETWVDPTAEERPRLQNLADRADPSRIVEAVRLFSDVAANRRAGWQPQLPLELAFVEATMTKQLAAVAPASIHDAPASRPITMPAKQTPTAAPEPALAPSAAANATPPITLPRASESPATREPAQHTSPAAVQTAAALPPDLVQKLAEGWRDLIRQIQPVSLGALLRDAQVGGSDPTGKLVLVFEHVFHCGKVNEDGNRRKVEEMLTQAAGQKMGVRCMLTKDWQGQTAEKPLGTTSATVQLEQDELVQRARAELGAVPKPES